MYSQMQFFFAEKMFFHLDFSDFPREALVVITCPSSGTLPYQLWFFVHHDTITLEARDPTALLWHVWLGVGGGGRGGIAACVAEG